MADSQIIAHYNSETSLVNGSVHYFPLHGRRYVTVAMKVTGASNGIGSKITLKQHFEWDDGTSSDVDFSPAQSATLAADNVVSLSMAQYVPMLAVEVSSIPAGDTAVDLVAIELG